MSPVVYFNNLVGHSKLTELKGLVANHELIEHIEGFVGHRKLTKLTSLIHDRHIKVFQA